MAETVNAIRFSDIKDARRLISPGEAAALYNLPEKTIRSALKDGELKGVKFPSRIGWRTTPEDLETWYRSLAEEAFRSRPVEVVAERLRRIKYTRAADLVASLPKLEQQKAEEEPAAS